MRSISRQKTIFMCEKQAENYVFCQASLRAKWWWITQSRNAIKRQQVNKHDGRRGLSPHTHTRTVNSNFCSHFLWQSPKKNEGRNSATFWGINTKAAFGSRGLTSLPACVCVFECVWYMCICIFYGGFVWSAAIFWASSGCRRRLWHLHCFGPGQKNIIINVRKIIIIMPQLVAVFCCCCCCRCSILASTSFMPHYFLAVRWDCSLALKPALALVLRLCFWPEKRPAKPPKVLEKFIKIPSEQQKSCK